jgi:chemotaxis protein CheX
MPGAPADGERMTPEDRSTISALLVELCQEMFAKTAHGFDEVAPEVAVVSQESRLAASVGLGGAELRGALIVVARNAFFRATYPPELGAASDADLADWAQEVVNQLLGRMKNRFAGLGINFNISTPTVVSGEHLRLCPADVSARIKKCLRIGGETVDVYFHIERDDGQGLLAHSGPPVAASAEGDAVLF